MRLFGFEISFRKALPPGATGTLSPPYGSGWGNWGGGWGNWWGGSWFGIVKESFTGAWQRNVEIRLDNVLTFAAVYRCVTMIASDIGKLDLELMEEQQGIEVETDNPAYSPVLREPNHYQTRQKFIEQWVTSKLIHGNTYVLLERDRRNVVVALYVLDPLVTRPLIAPNGDIYYSLATNNLAGVNELNDRYSFNGRDQTVVVPASEIIHDVMVPLYHPLCGVSPITACGLAAVAGLNIQNQSAKFFANNSRPSGLLTSPDRINEDQAKKMHEHWKDNYSGENAGRVAVLGGGLKFETISMNAVDSELISQLKWSSETVCTAFGVPAYMIGAGPAPVYGTNIEALNQQYYSQCLQTHIKAIEELLERGLGIASPYDILFDLNDLLRMDTATRIRSWGELVTRGIAAPNEARAEFGMLPVTGGESPMIQQQNYSLEALAKRDAKPDPFATAPKLAPPPQAQLPPPKALPPPMLDWSAENCLKGFTDAAA
jgi:HK97 family phage portal protein